MIRAVISDFGGVLTTPLSEAFAAMADDGFPREALRPAFERIAARDGEHPLFALERGEMTEAEFLAVLGAQMSEDLGRPVRMHPFAERYFAFLRPNERMIGAMRTLRERGLRMGLLTNNVREWEPHWRAMLPVDELFEVVVDSAFVGMRKPDARIYELTCARLGVEPPECVFVDDLEPNIAAARELGMTAVWFRDNERALAELEAAVGGRLAA